MKNYDCYKKNFSTLIILLSVLISLQNSLFAQNKAAEGMKGEEINFSSFSDRPIHNLASWKRINQPIYFSHPEFGVLPSDAPCSDCIEDLSKRTMDERYFVDNTDQNHYYQQKAMGQLHELIDGQWLTVDHRLKNSSNGVYLSGFQLDRAGFNVNEKSGFLETTLGKLSFNQWKLIVKKEGQLQPSIDADWSNFTIGEDGVKISSIFPGIDAEMRVLRGAIKTNFIIKTNEFGIFDELIFSDEFDAAGGVKLSFTDGATLEGVGDVFIKNDLGELAFIKQGILYAKNGPKESALDPIYRISANHLGVVVPYNWINENIDEYELIVDPLVTGTQALAQASILGSRFNASCNFTNSCDYNLTVARPSNATITDVTWSFNYVAIGPLCWRNDGAVRFSTATGGCLSPSAAGFYWFCNLPSSGNCNGTNISIFNDLGSCLPAPSCVSVDVTFTMQFFRTCWGTSGCNNTCIGAASPWTMTISGRTLEYTNAASNLTVSATTVCQGGTITASTTASYGVPPYTYNWSFSSTGSPSIGSGANATITFPTSGAITLYSFVTDFCGNVVSSSRVITVTPSPTITATPNTPTICSGQSTGIALNSSAVNTTYTWTVVQNGVSGASNGNQTGNAVSINQTLTATGSITGTATYTITPTVGGCSGAPITVVVTVNPNLTASVSAAASATTICDGSSITFTATPTNGGTAPSYQWYVNGTPIAGQTGTTFTSTTLTNGASITVQMTSNAAPCLLGSPATSNSIPITVTALLVPSVSITPSATVACAGASLTFTAAPTNGGTTPIYQWYVNGTAVAGQTNSTFTSTTLANGASITVQMTSNATPCLSTPTATSSPIVVTINPPLTASVSISASTNTICSGNSVTFTATPTNGGTTPSYQWYVNGNPVAGQTNSTFTSTTLTNGASVTVQMTSNAAPCLVGSPATSNSIPITVTALLVPSVSITPSATVACAGASLTFTAAPTNGGTTPTYQWYVNGTAVAGQTNSTFTSTTLANGASVTVQMTSNATPCLSTPTATSSPIVVTINPPLTASVSISASTNTICSGNSVTFTATPTNGGTAPSYQWYINGNPVAGQTNSTFTSTTLTNTASVTVQMTSNATPCLVGSPATSNAVSITVNPVLIPAVAILANTTTACTGASVTFTATPTNGGTTPSYQWYVNGNPVAGQTNSTFTSTTLTNTASVTVQMTSNATPCLVGSTATSNAVSITVNPALIPAVAVLANATTACAGASITFTATPTNGGTNPTYQWYVNGTAVAGQTNSTFTSTTLTNGASVTVQMTSNATPCLSTPTATSSAIVITVNPSITASVSISASTNTICSGNSVTFTATPTNGGTSPNYQWFINGNPVAGQTNSTLTSTTLTNGASVTVQMTSNATPCLVGSPATSNAVSITVNPVLIPAVAILANTTTACTGASVTFTATPTNGGTTPNYQWYVDGNPVAGQTNSTFTSTTLTNGASVTVQMTSNATPCLSTPTATSSPIVITINPSIAASVSISASTNTICSGNSVTFTATPTNGGITPTYQWFINGNPVAAQTNSTFTSTTLTNGASVTVQMTSNAAPCLIGSPTTSNAEIITVNPNPVVTATNNGPLCVTQQLDLTVTTIAGATYEWTGPQSFNSLSQNPSIPNVALVNAGNYTVTVNLNGCTSSATSTVTIVTGFPATINPSGPFCLNSGIVNLTASAGGGIWAGIGITNASNGSFNPSLGAVGINTISYTTPGACGGTSTIDILILPIPSISISSNVISGCAPLEVIFADNSTPTSSSVLWNFGNGVISSTLSTATYNSPGCYNVSLTSTNAGGCSTTETFIDFICVLEDPVADFTTDEFSTSLYNPTFELVNQSDFSVSYLWEFDNNTTSTLTDPTVSYPEEPGSYTVQLVAYNAAGCTDTITKILTVRDELVFFVPNSFTPNGDEFNNAFVPIFTSGFDPFEFNLTIINRWGELIFESNDATVGWDGTYHGKIVPDGMYVWKIRMKDIENDKKYTYTGHVNVLK